jgi:hypothetical protein
MDWPQSIDGRLQFALTDALNCDTCIYQLHIARDSYLCIQDAHSLYGRWFMRVVTRRMGFVFSPSVERTVAVRACKMALAAITLVRRLCGRRGWAAGR